MRELQQIDKNVQINTLIASLVNEDYLGSFYYPFLLP